MLILKNGWGEEAVGVVDLRVKCRQRKQQVQSAGQKQPRVRNWEEDRFGWLGRGEKMVGEQS